MTNLSKLYKSSGVLISSLSGNGLSNEDIIRDCMEKYSLGLMDGYCYGCDVCIDSEGYRYYLIPRISGNWVYVEFTRLSPKKLLSSSR